MKNRMRIGVGVIAAMVVVLAAGTAGAAFEDIEVSPRARAMGGAYTGFNQDPFAVFHNPASLAWNGDIRVAASYVRPFGHDFSSQSVVAGVAELGRWGGIGAGIRAFGVDFQDEGLTDETTFSLSHGFFLLQDLESEVAIGWTANIYSLSYGTSISGVDPGSDVALGFDLAAQALLYGRTRVGFYVLNVNNPSIGDVDEEELVRRLGAGVSYSPYPGVETVLDISNELGEDVQYRGGTEFMVTDFLRLRAGVRTGPNLFTAGAGVEHKSFHLDYGFNTGGGVLDATHQFAIGYTFPKSR